MMNRLYLLASSTSSSSSSLVIKPLLATPPLGFNLIKKYSNHPGGGHNEENIIDKERAQSTAEIMDELEHEKEDNVRTIDEKSQQGFVSHTSDKVLDVAQEVVGGGDTDPESLKEKFKEASPGETYHKPRDDGGVGPTSV